MEGDTWHCPCGSILCKSSSKNRHLKTKKHLAWVANNDNVNDATSNKSNKSNIKNNPVEIIQDNSTKKKTKKRSKRSSERQDTEHQECVVCLNSYSDPKKLSVCGHTFCKACINKWLKCNKNCPCCRRNVLESEIPQPAMNIQHESNILLNILHVIGLD